MIIKITKRVMTNPNSVCHNSLIIPITYYYFYLFIFPLVTHEDVDEHM